ncbi:HNH endonuclease [Intrasporangium calvum]|uniref:HNH endonuclease n=1 Tax=Intrasporangium calvum TaxID=53358 RepID=UPI000DF5CA8F|nr:HNH endonuclease signature motif containing protein [Intrasporangium calvum]AXG14773.1 HNH endonuclease [Intrasporangium calvum]
MARPGDDPLGAADLDGLVAVLALLDGDAGAADDAGRVDQLDALERVKAACAAAQVRITARFVDSQATVAEDHRARAAERSAANDFEGWRAKRELARRSEFEPVSLDPRAVRAAGARRRGTFDRAGIAAQVGLARHESPARGARLATIALSLSRDLPHTLAALGEGLLVERRAELVARLTSHLDRDQRGEVDAEVIGGAGAAVRTWGDRELEQRIRACADRIDAAAAVARARTAESERRVTLRPIPDTMAIVSAVLPVREAVAVHAALTRAADRAKGEGDDRSRGQVMADTLVDRVVRSVAATTASGEAPPDQLADEPADVPVEVQIVITDRALLAGADTPAHIPGYGPVPAGWARELLTRSLADDVIAAGSPPRPGAPPPHRAHERAKVWLRRLYTHPHTGALVAMESKRRLFPPGLRRLIIARDGTCRTPWCDAPIRHVDHVRAHRTGGTTSERNGQGLCVRCNLVKEQAGWHARVTDPGHSSGSEQPHAVTLTTPTGHRHTTAAPPVLPGTASTRSDSPLESHLAHLLAS